MDMYLNKCEREDYKYVLKTMFNIYKEKLHPLLDTEEEGQKEADKMWERIQKRPYNENYDIDDLAEQCGEHGYEHGIVVSLLQYQYLLNQICCLSQVWEQQCFMFIAESYRQLFEKKKDEIRKWKFKDLLNWFKAHNIDLTEMKVWPKINELRLLVNTIKHGYSESSEELQKQRPDFFIKENIFDEDMDLFEFYKTSICERTLNVSIDDLEEYTKTLCSFWEELPSHMPFKKK